VSTLDAARRSVGEGGGVADQMHVLQF